MKFQLGAVGIMGAMTRPDWITSLWLSSIRLGRLGDVAREVPFLKKKIKYISIKLVINHFWLFFWGSVYSSVMFSTFICEWHGNSELWINWITTSLFVTSRLMLVFLRGILMNDPQLAMDSKDSRQMTIYHNPQLLFGNKPNYLCWESFLHTTFTFIHHI